MATERIQSLLTLLERNPDDARVRFGLATEYEKHGLWPQAVEQFTAYLAQADDEGNAWGRLAHALHELGRDEDACDALRRGIEQSERYGHPSMADAFREQLAEWGVET
jgi:tetratricopeptide (TPR) repeat protein